MRLELWRLLIALVTLALFSLLCLSASELFHFLPRVLSEFLAKKKSSGTHASTKTGAYSRTTVGESLPECSHTPTDSRPAKSQKETRPLQTLYSLVSKCDRCGRRDPTLDYVLFGCDHVICMFCHESSAEKVWLQQLVPENLADNVFCPICFMLLEPFDCTLIRQSRWFTCLFQWLHRLVCTLVSRN